MMDDHLGKKNVHIRHSDATEMDGDCNRMIMDIYLEEIECEVGLIYIYIIVEWKINRIREDVNNLFWTVGIPRSPGAAAARERSRSPGGFPQFGVVGGMEMNRISTRIRPWFKGMESNERSQLRTQAMICWLINNQQ